MPKFAGVRPKPIERLGKKKRPARVKKPAIPEKVKVKLMGYNAKLPQLKIQVQKMKLGTSLLEGKFADVSKNYNELKKMEASAKAELDYISEIKEGKKINEQVSKFEEVVEKFREDTRTAQKFIERAIGNKLHSLYENVLRFEKENLNKLSSKQRKKFKDNLENTLEEYKDIKNTFSQINFSGPNGVDYRLEKMQSILEKM